MQGFIARLLGRNSEPQPDIITVAEHELLIGIRVDQACKRLRDENSSLEAELTNTRRSNQAAMTQATTLRFENEKLAAEIEALRPDAEAHRARLARDRDYHRNRRSLKTRALSLQPASPAMSESIGH